MKKILSTFLVMIVALMSLGFVFSPECALAAAPNISGSDSPLGSVGDAAGVAQTSNTDLPQIVGQIIKVVLSFLGVIAVILVIYAGFLWMTAGGSSEKVDKAKSIMVQAAIGLVIILAAYSITNFVVGGLTDATGLN